MKDMDFEAFKLLVEEIMSQGHDQATASRYASLIGDMHCSDEHGNVVVLDEHGKEIARLKPLKFFDA